MYPQSMFYVNMKNVIYFFYLKMYIFTAVKYCCILHGHVFVMCGRCSVFLISPVFVRPTGSHDVD